LNFKETPQQEEHKIIFSGLQIYKIALSNRTDYPAFFYLLKGIVQRILSGVYTMLKKSVLVNWRPARFCLTLKGHHHKRSKKPFLAA
jgi:hypothetical protein